MAQSQFQLQEFAHIRRVRQSDDTSEETSSNMTVKKPKFCIEGIENPDYSWIWRLSRLQKIHIMKVHQTQYELACLSTMGGAYSICRYPKQALQIAKHQELVGIRIGSQKVQCHAKLYQYINLMFLGKKRAGLMMLEAAKQQSELLESDSVRKHCDITENWLNNEIKYKYSKKSTSEDSGSTVLIE